MTRKIISASLVVLMSYDVFGQATALSKAQRSRADVQPDVRLSAEGAGWDKVVKGLLSAFDKADVVALGRQTG